MGLFTSAAGASVRQRTQGGEILPMAVRAVFRFGVYRLAALRPERGAVHAYINEGSEIGVAFVVYVSAPGPDDRVVVEPSGK